jgi:hypothetical protein
MSAVLFVSSQCDLVTGYIRSVEGASVVCVTMTPDEVVDQARQRCNQENLISQLKSGVRSPAPTRQHLVRQLGLHDDGHAHQEPKGVACPER